MLIENPGPIDVHAHCVPRRLHESIARHGSELGISVGHGDHGTWWSFDTGRQTAPIEPLLLDASARLSRMDDRGIGVTLLSSFIDIGAHHVGPTVAGRYARLFNEELAAVVAEHPTRLLGLATLPVQSPALAVAELRHAVGDLGFVGAEVAAEAVGEPGLESLWEAAADLGAIVFVHPGASTSARLPFFLGNFVGNPAETTVAAAILMASGVLERHPDLVMLLAHGGGFLPYQVGRIEKGFDTFGSRFGAVWTEPPRRQLRRLYYDTILHDSAALSALVGAVGADRVLLGTDDPFAMGDADPLATLRTTKHLTDDERRLITRDNALRLIAVVERNVT